MALSGVAFRLLSLNNLTNDHYMNLALAQQVVLGEWPWYDFVDPSGPLPYLISAGVQAISRGPFAEAILTISLVGCAIGAACVAVFRLTGSLPAAIAASAFALMLETRLYGYPKILIPAVAVCAALSYTRAPGTWTRLRLAAWVAISFLLRFDLGAFAAVFAAVVVFLRGASTPRGLADVARLAGLTVVLLSPLFVYVFRAAGLSALLADTLEFAKSEPNGFSVLLPAFTSGVFDQHDAAAFLMYGTHALVVVPALLAAATWSRLGRTRAPVIVGATIMVVLYDIVIVREPLTSRVGDAATLLAIVGAWCVVTFAREIRRQSRWPAVARTTVLASLAGVTVMAFVSADLVANFHNHLRETRIAGGPSMVLERLQRQLNDSRRWPWERYWPGQPLPELVQYIEACTQPSDRLLVTWAAPEYYVLTRRGFAAGHAWFPASGGYRSAAAQQLMLDRLDARSVPIVVINEDRRDDLAALPRLDAHVAANYAPAGRIASVDGMVTIAVHRALVPNSTFGAQQWPCDLRPAGHVAGD